MRLDTFLVLSDKSVNKHPCTCQPRVPHLSLSYLEMLYCTGFLEEVSIMQNWFAS